MAASVLVSPVTGVCVRGSGFRCLSLSSRCNKKKKKDSEQPRVRQDPPDIPGLERITFVDRQYFLPWLARPKFQRWQKDWHDPLHYFSPAHQDMALYKEREAYVFSHKCRLLGGVKQALWLTKSSLIEGLPESITSIYEDPTFSFPNHEEVIHDAVYNACLWSTTEEQRPKEEYCPKLLQSLLHLCRMQSCSYPGLSQRSFIENYRLGTSWTRESVLYLVRGITGIVMSAKTALEPQASASTIQATEQHTLDSLYPLSPAIDLQELNVYEQRNYLGFKDGYSFIHPHTIYLIDPVSTKARFLPDQLRAKMIMFAFGSAVAKAKMLFGEDVGDLEKPIVVQSVATDGQLFHFMVLQLNTLDLDSSNGIKNIIWMDGDQALYDTVAGRAEIVRKVVVVPAGVSGLKPETFLKFWAMYLHGAV